jgi:hypothetical protein
MHSTHVPHQVSPVSEHLLANLAQNDLHIRRVIDGGAFRLHLAPSGPLEVVIGVAVPDVRSQPFEGFMAVGTVVPEKLLLDLPSWSFQVRAEHVLLQAPLFGIARSAMSALELMMEPKFSFGHVLFLHVQEQVPLRFVHLPADVAEKAIAR